MHNTDNLTNISSFQLNIFQFYSEHSQQVMGDRNKTSHLNIAHTKERSLLHVTFENIWDLTKELLPVITNMKKIQRKMIFWA